MRQTPFKRTIAMGALALFVFAGAAGEPSANVKTAQGLYDAGFDLFNGYENSDAQRMKGWDMMTRAAGAGCLEAKRRVADFAAGFLSLNKDPGSPSVFKPNLPLALGYYRELARDGSLGSMVHLAILFSSGIGEPADESESPHALLTKAARKGNREAMSLLGQRYLYGHGENKDVLEAARWEYLATVNSEESSHWVDQEGAPRIQDTPEQDEMAKILSLFYKTGRSRDLATTARLRAMFEAAGKSFNLPEILNAVKRSNQ